MIFGITERDMLHNHADGLLRPESFQFQPRKAAHVCSRASVRVSGRAEVSAPYLCLLLNMFSFFDIRADSCVWRKQVEGNSPSAPVPPGWSPCACGEQPKLLAHPCCFALLILGTRNTGTALKQTYHSLDWGDHPDTALPPSL